MSNVGWLAALLMHRCSEAAVKPPSTATADVVVAAAAFSRETQITNAAHLGTRIKPTLDWLRTSELHNVL